MTELKHSNHDSYFVRISLGGTSLGIDLKNVKELINCREIAVIPGTPLFLDGFIKVRTLSVPVIDLRRRFSLSPDVGPLTRIIIANVDGSIVGFIVDRVKEITGGVRAVHEQSDNGHPWHTCVDSVTETNDGRVPVINLSLILTEEEKKYLKAPASAISYDDQTRVMVINEKK